MELLGRRSPAPAQDIARRMVGRVLTGNGITRYGDGLYTLIGAEELSDSERDALLKLCRQRLDGFRAQRGEEVFAHRSRQRSPISGSAKVRVLTRARGRCECCGARLLLSKPRISGH
jgi:ATP adenylyltransferase